MVLTLELVQASTRYNGVCESGYPFTADSPLVQWFWAYVRRLPSDSLALLLKFCTGCSSVPPAGFWHLYGYSGEQTFSISLVGPGDSRLPTASTCFNQLKLPEYSDAQTLEEKLHIALHYGSEGFTFS
jgi:E3 ubiquitin-protein ligase HUWE1